MEVKFYTGRCPGKQYKSFYESLDGVITRLPNFSKYVIATNDSMYELIKKLPEAYFRGRWLYVNYKNHIFSVRKIQIPNGFKTTKINRIKTSPEVKVYRNEPVPENKQVGLFKLNWELFVHSKPIKISENDKGIWRRIKKK